VCWYVRLLPFLVTASDFDDAANDIILACDYVNSRNQHWVPILAILCDGEKFEFLVYDSGIKSVYASRMATGVLDLPDNNELLAPSLKRGKVADNLHLQY
jgi:hypothetical protein